MNNTHRPDWLSSNSKPFKNKLLVITIILCRAILSTCDQLVHVQVPLGQPAILPCYVDIIGNVQVVWLSPRLDLVSYNEEIRMPDGRFSLVREEKRDWHLRIADTSVSDAGNYSCQVTLGSDVLKYAVRLVNLISPTARLNASYVEIKKGGKLTLECIVTGVPKPSIQWLFYKFNQSEKNVMMPFENSTLLEKELVSEEDAGKYICFASNSVAPVSVQTCYVNILFAPVIKMTYTKIIQNRGDLVRIDCPVNSNPVSKISWSFSQGKNQEFAPLKFGSPSSTSDSIGFCSCRSDLGYWNSYVMVIRNASFEDAGFYRCEADSLLGNYKKAVELSIQEENTFEMISKPSHTSALAGSQTTIFCSIKQQANNSVTVTWFRETPRGLVTIFSSGSKVQPVVKNIRVVGQYDLEMKNIVKADEGYYTCQISSYGNRFNFTMFLSVIETSSVKICDGRLSILNIILIIFLVIIFIGFLIVLIILLHHLKILNLDVLLQCKRYDFK